MKDVYENEIEKLKDDWKFKQKQDRAKKNSLEHEKHSQQFERVEDKYFDLLKNLTILSGTVFASSIALSTGRNVNMIFIFGEFFLLLSTTAGAIYLWAQLRSREWSYFMDVKGHLELDMIANKEIMEDFEKKFTEESIREYNRLMNKKEFLYHILKIIKIDWVPNITFTTLFIGLVLIWLSLVP